VQQQVLILVNCLDLFSLEVKGFVLVQNFKEEVLRMSAKEEMGKEKCPESPGWKSPEKS
jgi:hypothetical protein